jgi:hypothetical protein
VTYSRPESLAFSIEGDALDFTLIRLYTVESGGELSYDWLEKENKSLDFLAKVEEGHAVITRLDD